MKPYSAMSSIQRIFFTPVDEEKLTSLRAGHDRTLPVVPLLHLR